MSVAVAKDKDVTVITIKTNSESMFPPLCQILGAFCYSPVCCSVNKGMMKTCATAVLGTIQILVGLMIIALDPERPFTHHMDVKSLGVAYWLGAVIIVVGIMSILAGHFPSRCLVSFTVLMNFVGAIFASFGIFVYGIDLDEHNNGMLLDWYEEPRGYSGIVSERLLVNIDAVIIALAVLQVCVNISFVVLGIKALVNLKKKEGDKDVDELKQVLMTSPSA